MSEVITSPTTDDLLLTGRFRYNSRTRAMVFEFDEGVECGSLTIEAQPDSEYGACWTRGHSGEDIPNIPAVRLAFNRRTERLGEVVIICEGDMWD